MRVLIIDDSALMRRIVAKALREAGVELDEVVEAGNGAEAIARLASLDAEGREVDLILCDVHMPGMDGVGFLKERAARGLTRTPVVMVTADPSDPLVAQAVAVGAAGFIAKPFSANQVREQVLALAEQA